MLGKSPFVGSSENRKKKKKEKRSIASDMLTVERLPNMS